MDTPPVLPPPLPVSVSRPVLGAAGRKLIAIGVLLALLWGALQTIDGLRRDRLAARDEAMADIAQTWGGEQLLAGPVLAVPFTYPAKVTRELASDRNAPVRSEEVRTVRACAYFLPAELEVTGQLDPSVRYRGIFTVPVYEAKLGLRGRFRPDPAAIGVDGAVFEWERARFIVALRQPRGLRAAPVVEWAGVSATLEPGLERDGWCDALEAIVRAAPAAGPEGQSFALEMTLQGSRRLAVAPVGAANRMALKSTWPDPSFGGANLPVRRTVTAAGFEAQWEQSYFGRGYPQQWTDAADHTPVVFAAIEHSALEVALLQPVDAYRLVERAIKYGVLFLMLVFAVFFLFEVTARLRIHPLQYLMVGAALVLFFLGYLALSEFIVPGLAYAAAAAASTILVTGYSASVLHTGRRSFVVGAGVAGTYGYLYFVLQLQDYALLAGSMALFALLTVAMWTTRKINWYASEQRSAVEG